MQDETDVHPLVLKHWRGALNINHSWPRSAYHSIMYMLLAPFLRGR